MSEFSGSFTRNPEVINAPMLRPHNTGLNNVLIPESAYTKNNNAHVRPSNLSVLAHLNSNNGKVVGTAVELGRESNVNIEEGGSLIGNIKLIRDRLRKARRINEMRKQGILQF